MSEVSRTVDSRTAEGRSAARGEPAGSGWLPLRAVLIWAALLGALLVPLGIAATSPLLQWRDPVYIAAGLAGVVALGLMLVQPVLAANALPGPGPASSRLWHRWIGTALVAAVAVHVMGLWITSPPDVIDVLLFRSPTPFSVWGALAMWALVGTALIAATRRRWRPRVWKRTHSALAVLAVGGTIAHAMLIEGTMGTISKAALCIAVAVVGTWAAARTWRGGRST